MSKSNINMAGLSKNYKFMLNIMWSYDKGFFIVSLLKSFISGISPVINIIFPKYIIDQFNKNGMKSIILLVSVWAIIDIILICVNKSIEKYLSIRRDFLNNHFIFSVYEKMVNLDMSLLNDPKIFDMKQKAEEVAGNNIARNFCNDIFNMISSIITIATTFVVLTSVDFAVFVVLTVIIIFNIIILSLQKKEQYSFWDIIAPLNKEMDYYYRLLSDPVHSKEMKMYSLSSWIIFKYKLVKNKFFDLSKTLYKKIYFMNSIQQSISILQRSFLYIYLAWKVIYQHMSFGNFTMYFSAINSFSTNISNIINIFVNEVEKSVYIGSYKQFLELENKIAIELDPMSLKKLPYGLKKITFENVSFSYPGQTYKALSNINISFLPNNLYVIVGHNGAGKTTLINLLCRLYDPTEGKITLNGQDIKDFNYKEYRDLFGVVFQDYKYYGFTIAENITMSQYENDGQNRIKILDSLKKAGLENRINSLPKGIDTYLTRIFSEDGINLSGGESQKLALAKSLYKNAQFLVLDEPSSSLDPFSEADLINQIKLISHDKCVIYISHRLSTAIYADQVIFMDNGNISAVGSHKELMKKCFKYAEMFNLQAKNYQDNVEDEVITNDV